MKKLALLLSVVVLTSFTTVTEQRRECQTSESSQFNSGGYVVGGILYVWVKRGNDITITSHSAGTCKELKEMSIKNGWVYLQ